MSAGGGAGLGAIRQRREHAADLADDLRVVDRERELRFRVFRRELDGRVEPFLHLAGEALRERFRDRDQLAVAA